MGIHLGPSVRRYLGPQSLGGATAPSGSGEPCGFVDSLRSLSYQMPFTAADLRMIDCPTLWHARRLLACTSRHSKASEQTPSDGKRPSASRPRLTASDPVRVGDRMILGEMGIR